MRWSGRQDLNLRPLEPKSSALAKLSYVRIYGRLKTTPHLSGTTPKFIVCANIVQD